jgi:hypothetical protein
VSTGSVVDRLVSARAEYEAQVSHAYDEVLHEVAARVNATGSIGKSDIGALLVWKRLRADTRWALALMSLPEAEVRAVTAGAVAAVRDQERSTPEVAKAGRRALSPLPGFATGDALASALLVAAAPRRMAVYDRRAQRGLTILNFTLTAERGRYSRYMEHVEEMLDMVRPERPTWLARDVDLALYWLGKSG